MIDRAPILITGCPRSGGNMIAGALHLCGAFGGVFERKGIFENMEIRRNVEHVYMNEHGWDPHGQYPLPDTTQLQIPANWQQQVEGIIEYFGYKRGPWMVKSPLIALLWPIWHYAYPNAKWIIVRRKTPDVIDSCIKTGFMTAFKEPSICKLVGVEDEWHGWLWWVHEYEKRFVDMINEGLDCKVVFPERMVHADYSQMKDTCSWLGLPWKTEILDFIDPLLWTSRKKLTVQ